MIIYPDENDDFLANRMIASTRISEQMKKTLEQMSPDIRMAMEALIADGLVEERGPNCGVGITERGMRFMEQVEDLFNDE